MSLPSYEYEISISTKRKHKILQILFSLSFSLFVIFAAVKLTLMFKPLYYFDIGYLNIVEQSNYSKAEIVENYNYVINYLLIPKEQEFNLPSIPYSEYGQIHFKDVKRIFTSINILLIITGFITLIGSIITIKDKNWNFLRQASSILIVLPVVLLTAFMINFDTAFTVFHKIFFRNDYWIFNPEIDPIINILPQEFFYHSALLITALIIISIISLRVIYKILSVEKQV